MWPQVLHPQAVCPARPPCRPRRGLVPGGPTDTQSHAMGQPDLRSPPSQILTQSRVQLVGRNRSESPSCKKCRRHCQYAGPGGFHVAGAGARLTSLTHHTAIRPQHLPRHVPKFLVPVQSLPCSRSSAQASSWDPGDESQTDRAPSTSLHKAPGPRPGPTQSGWTFRIQVPGPCCRGRRCQRGQSGAQRVLNCSSQASVWAARTQSPAPVPWTQPARQLAPRVILADSPDSDSSPPQM